MYIVGDHSGFYFHYAKEIRIRKIFKEVIELGFPDEILHPSADTLDVESGFLVRNEGTLCFQNELIRLTIEGALTMDRLKDLHQTILQPRKRWHASCILPLAAGTRIWFSNMRIIS